MSIIKHQVEPGWWIAVDTDTPIPIERLIEHKHSAWTVLLDGHEAIHTYDPKAMDAALRLLAPDFRDKLIAFTSAANP